jgi:hypothetical protein
MEAAGWFNTKTIVIRSAGFLSLPGSVAEDRFRRAGGGDLGPWPLALAIITGDADGTIRGED